MRHVPVLALAVLFFAALVSLVRPSHAQSGDPGVLLVNGWNVGAVASGAKVFATDIKPTKAGSVLRIAVRLSASVPLSIYETDGTTSFTTALNNGTALTGGTANTFVWELRNSKAAGGVAGPTAFNFVVGGPTNVDILRGTEVIASVD